MASRGGCDARSYIPRARGESGGSSERRGTVAELLESIPYLLADRLLPPLRVVNDVLRRGVHDAGMSGGCSWRPFEITPVRVGRSCTRSVRSRSKHTMPVRRAAGMGSDHR